MAQNNEIVIYRPNAKLQLQVRLENETIWLTQSQIADLFAVQRPAITKHLGNIFASHELEESSVSSILEHTAQDGKTYQVDLYLIGASLKDLGKRLFAFIEMNKQHIPDLITRIEN